MTDEDVEIAKLRMDNLKIFINQNKYYKYGIVEYICPDGKTFSDLEEAKKHAILALIKKEHIKDGYIYRCFDLGPFSDLEEAKRHAILALIKKEHIEDGYVYRCPDGKAFGDLEEAKKHVISLIKKEYIKDGYIYKCSDLVPFIDLEEAKRHEISIRRNSIIYPDFRYVDPGLLEALKTPSDSTGAWDIVPKEPYKFYLAVHGGLVRQM